jgi:hypothetical protein
MAVGIFINLFYYGGVCQMRKCSWGIKWFALVVVIGFFMTSCGGSATEEANSGINGVWKSDDGNKELTININGESKTIEMDGKIMPVTIESDTYKSMIVQVQEDTDTVSTWTFQKVWNDNGSSFTVILTLPDGTRENFAKETPS